MVKRLIFSAALAAGAAAGAREAVAPFEGAEWTANGRIDELVAANWKRFQVEPARLCSDSVFLRRAYLDATGTVPTAEQAAEFLASREAGKRAALVERLLAREEFALYQAMRWSDLLRIKAEFPINLWPQAAQAYHHWVLSSLRENKPYDKFVREMLTASGSNFRVPPVNFYRAMEGRDAERIARAVALTFMGARAEKWPQERLAGMRALFSEVGYKETSEWKEEIVFPRDTGAMDGRTVTMPDGSRVRMESGRDPREVFAAWLTAPKNPWFAASAVNRIWYWLMGRGIVHEPDDIRSDNPPENPALLAYLEGELVRSGYDLKQIYRLVLNSNTYQLSALTKDPDGGEHFAHYPLRRLEAEVLIDAICQITGTSELYTSAIPEPYTFMPDYQRAIALPDGSISSSFLELFGRPSRDTGLASERSNRPSDAQRLHLLNSTHVQRKIQQGPKLTALVRDVRQPRELVSQLYLAILSRYPTAEEFQAVAAHTQTGGARGREAAIDLAWALLNTTEFQYRH